MSELNSHSYLANSKTPEYRGSSKSSHFMSSSALWISEFCAYIHNQWSQKAPSTSFHLKRATFCILDPPHWISEFSLHIRNQRPRKPASTEFRPNLVTFCIFVRYIGPAMFNFQISTWNSDSVVQKTHKYRFSITKLVIQAIFEFGFTIRYHSKVE